MIKKVIIGVAVSVLIMVALTIFIQSIDDYEQRMIMISKIKFIFIAAGAASAVGYLIFEITDTIHTRRIRKLFKKESENDEETDDDRGNE